MSEWQDICTAPKDGKAVLVYGIQAGEISGVHDEPTMCFAYYNTRVSTDYHGFDWVCCDGDAYVVWVKPTHWMLLPEPPVST